MYYIYFQDTTHLLKDKRIQDLPRIRMLRERGLLADRFFKMFASPLDPRTELKFYEYAVLPDFDGLFTEKDVYTYEGRGTYTGVDFMEHLQRMGLNSFATEVACALTRAMHHPKLRFIQRAMESIDPATGEYDVPYPLSILDGTDRIQTALSYRDTALHHDILTKGSVARLGEVFHLWNKTACVPKEKGELLRRTVLAQWQTREGARRGIEG